MLGFDDILSQLNQFEKAKGKTVIVHTSLKAVGKIDGGAETLLNALIEYFTSDDGILCVPTHTWNTTVYDRRKSESCVGALPIAAAAHPDALRTLHPTHSIALFGDIVKTNEYAEFESVSDTPANPNGPLGKLYRDGGYVLLIGVGHTKNTYLHCVEEMLNVPERLTAEKVERAIIHKDGKIEKRYLHWYDNSKIDDVSANFGKFEKAFRYHGCIIDGKIGNAEVQLCDARKMKDILELIYTNNGYKELLSDDLPLDDALYK